MKGHRETGHGSVPQPLVEPHVGHSLNAVPEMHIISQNYNIIQYKTKIIHFLGKGFAFTNF